MHFFALAFEHFSNESQASVFALITPQWITIWISKILLGNLITFLQCFWCIILLEFVCFFSYCLFVFSFDDSFSGFSNLFSAFLHTFQQQLLIFH